MSSVLRTDKRSSAVPVIADHTAYGVQYSYRPLSGIAVVLVTMSIYLFITFELKSAFGVRRLFSCLIAAMIHPIAKVSEEVKRKCLL